MLSKRDKMSLGYLSKAAQPVWGAHLSRGEPVTDPDMQRWLDLGLIEQAGNGYVLTETGKRALSE